MSTRTEDATGRLFVKLAGVGLGVGLMALLLLAYLLSRRQRLPDLFGLDPALVEPFGHAVLAGVLAILTMFLIARLPRASASTRASALLSFVAVSACTTLIELGQISLRNRSAGLGDIVANLIGAGLGTLAGVLLNRSTVLVQKLVLAALLLTALGGGLWAVLVDVPLGTSCDADTPEQLGDLPPPAVTTAVVAYDMSDRVGSRQPPVLEQTGGPALHAGGTGSLGFSPSGVVFDHDARDAFLISKDAGAQIIEAVTESGGVTIEVAATPNAMNVGPARIVSVSDGISTKDMNIHIGQEGDRLSVRLRLGCGLFNITEIEDVFSIGQRRHIVASFSDGVQRVWVDDQLLDERTYLEPTAIIDNWDPSMPLVIGNEPTGDRQFIGSIEMVKIAD